MKETKRPKKARSKRRKVSREKRERILEKTLKQTEYSERSEKEQAQIKRRISGEQQREKEIQRAPKNKVKISRISTKRSELQSIRERRGGKSCLNWVFPYLQLSHPLVFSFFVQRRMRFLILGRSVGLKKRKPKNKRLQEVSEQEAWYPSVIAVEPGNNNTADKHFACTKV